MTLEEQFEQWKEDVKNYINPELMWEGGVTSHTSYGDIEFSGIVQMPEGIEFDVFVKSMDEVWRKQSAALPFDKIAAFKGDAVEFFYFGEWIDANPIGINKDNGIEIYFIGKPYFWNGKSRTDRVTAVYDYSQLRMKHPRRVGVYYSQFGDKS